MSTITEKWRLRKLGASNAMAAYALYAGKVPPLSMLVLAYMALVSKDSDAEPWWSQGHEHLAEMAMGREPLRPTGDEQVDAKAKRAMEGAVERAIAPLFKCGAITVGRHSGGRPGGGTHVRYRLHLTRQPVDNQRASHGIRGVDNPPEQGAEDEHPTDSVGRDGRASHGFRASIPRFPCEHPTDSVGLRNRGIEEQEERQEPSHPSSGPVPPVAREGADEAKLIGAGRTAGLARWADPRDIAARQLAESRAMREGPPP